MTTVANMHVLSEAARFFFLLFPVSNSLNMQLYHDDRAHCSASRCFEQTALTVLVPLSVSAGLEPFSLSLLLVNVTGSTAAA